MSGGSVLISGVGIAGSTLAYWLLENGFQPTLIERAPQLRSDGYIIDFWGRGYDIAERCERLRPFIDQKQIAAQRFAMSFGPATTLGIFVRNQVSKMMQVPFIANFAVGRDLRDDLVLPEYRAEKCRSERVGQSVIEWHGA